MFSNPKTLCRRSLACAAAALSCTAVAPGARATPPAHVEVCAACHGPHGRSVSAEIPHLAGQRHTYLQKQLKAFRSGERKDDLMEPIAKQLSDDDIVRLATFWSRLPASGESGAAAPAGLPSAMQMPAGFPADFTVYDTVADEASRTVTVRSANAQALDAARRGRAPQPGAVVVSAEYAAAVGADQQLMRDASGRLKPGVLRAVAGMEVRAGWGEQVPALLRNGDWHYGLWGPRGETRLRAGQAQCLACHQPQSGNHHVFTWPALMNAAR